MEPTKFKNEEGARRAIADLATRKEELGRESESLAGEIQDRKREIAAQIFVRRDVSKLTEQNARDSDKLAAMLDAVKICDSEIESAKSFIGQQYRSEFEELRKRFAKEYVGYLDTEMLAARNGLNGLKKTYDDLMNACGKAYVSRQESGFPFMETQLFFLLFNSLAEERGGMLADIKHTEGNFVDYFKQARSGR